MKRNLLFPLFLMLGTFLQAQVKSELNSEFQSDAKTYALTNLGFEAKLLNLGSNVSRTSVNDEVVKKSPRTLQEILASSKRTNLKYHLIAGCFSTIDNANRLVTQLSRKGYPSEIIAKNDKGLYMVSYLTYTSEAAALESLQDLKDEGKSTWISIR